MDGFELIDLDDDDDKGTESGNLEMSSEADDADWAMVQDETSGAYLLYSRS